MIKEKASKKTSSKARSGKRKAGSKSVSKSTTASLACMERPLVLTHEQISERAKKIWHERGCTPGLDEQNWCDAETQLKSELKVL